MLEKFFEGIHGKPLDGVKCFSLQQCQSDPELMWCADWKNEELCKTSLEGDKKAENSLQQESQSYRMEYGTS
jgi:hypothetical protein